MKLPKPGNPVRGSRSGAPVMALLDLLGRHWSMGILWGLSSEAMTFRKLQEYCETVSPTTLNTRIKELTAMGLVEKTAEGYALTRMGKELFTLMEPLGAWSKKWARTLK